MFEEELMELKARRSAKNNKRFAVIAVVVLWLALIIEFFARNYYSLETYYGRIIPLTLGIRFIALVIAALVFARSLKEISKKVKRRKNGIAAAISLLVLCLSVAHLYSSFFQPLAEKIY